MSPMEVLLPCLLQSYLQLPAADQEPQRLIDVQVFIPLRDMEFLAA